MFTIITTAQSLDPTFDIDGLVNNPISNIPSVQNIYDGILQSDGKMIYVGRYHNSGGGLTSGIIVRYNVDGTKDLSFNNTGFRNSSLGLGLQSVCLQSDGKIIVVGSSSLYRLLVNGDLDLTFNVVGNRSISLGGQIMNIKSVSVQLDNKIIVSGSISNGTNTDLAVARLNANGTLDTTFDTDGIFTYNSSTIDNGFSHKIQSNGKIVIVGDTGATTGTKNFIILRINSNGTLDTSFNSTGINITDFASTSDFGRDVQILSDNSILVLGRSAGNVALAKFTSSGILDVSFNTTGKKTFAIPIDFNTSSGLDILPKIKVLATGSILVSCSSTSDYKVIKLDSSGNFDNTFATNGVFTSNSETDLSTFLQIKSNGNILTGGISYTTAINSDAKIKEIEVTSNGILINSLTKNVYLSIDKYVCMSKNSNGDFFVLASLTGCTLLKYNSAGQLDTSFGTLGKVSLSQNYNKIKFLNNGKIVLGGFINPYVRILNSDGTDDLSFNLTGLIDLSSHTSNKMQYPDAIFVNSTNKILISGDYIFPNNDHIFGMLQLNLDGTIDLTYGNNGYFYQKIHPAATEEAFDYGRTIQEQSDGKIVVGGTSNPVIGGNPSNIYNHFALRLNANGTIDTSYGNSGVFYFPAENNYYINDDEDSQITIDNKLYLTYFNNVNLTKTVRINSNGTYDNSFGINGTVNDIGGTYSPIRLQTDGKILRGGIKNQQFSIIRYNANGSIDTTFGLNGEVNTVLGVSSSIADLVLQPDGKIVVGGTSITSDYQLVVLARFTNTVLGILDFSSTKNPLSIYPNPIETAAIFEFTLMNSENITIELYDVQGKLAQTIATNKQMASGNHNLPIELNHNLTSGNYFLKLTTANGSQSIQIIKK